MKLSSIRRALVTLVPLFPLVAVACGDSMTSSPTPVTHIQGNVQNQSGISVAHPERFHITAVWVGPNKEIPFADNISATSSFPSSFTLDVVHTPPPEAAQEVPLDSKGTISVHFIAEIGAYDDVNGNGNFDFEAGDTLLGIAPRVRLIYVTEQDDIGKIRGTYPNAQLGFNVLVVQDDNDCTHPYYAGIGCKDAKIIPLDSQIVLQLTQNAKFE